MNSPVLLAIDVGTGSARAVLFDDRLRQLAVVGREWTHPATPGVPGGQDFDVVSNWTAICACVQEVFVAAGRSADDVAAVSSTSMREGIVLLDETGAEIWACPNVDSRAGAQAEELVRSGAAERIYDRAGDWVSITTPARLRWLTERAPDVLDRAAALLLLSDWVAYRLCGAVATEPSCGSSSGMFDLSARSWSAEIAALVGVAPGLLPKVVESGTVVGEVSPAAAAATGLRAGTPVIAGGGDTQLGLLGAGVGPGDVTVVGGTFWQTTMLLDRPAIDPQRRLRTLCHAGPDQWMIEGIGFYSGLSFRYMRDAFCDREVASAAEQDIDPYLLMEDLAATIPPGSNGVLAILSNAMNARSWTHASPAFVQLDLSDPAGTGRAACVRAVQEAAAYAARAHVELIAEVTGRGPRAVVFTGGAARGRLWPQIMADVLGVPVHVPTVTESSARGAALLAAVGVGVLSGPSDVDDLAARQRTVEPRPDAVATYQDAYPYWRRAYARLLDLSEDGALRPLWIAAGSLIDRS